MSAFNKSFSRGAPQGHTVDQIMLVILGELLGLSLTALIAVTCLHELEKSEIFDVHYRYKITMCANICMVCTGKFKKSFVTVILKYTPL